MREILFRGKRLDNGEWVEGYLVKHFEKCYIYYEEPDEMCQVGSWFCGAEVIPETVGQYTGLTDKNGKKIFEGDICTGENSTLFKVIWNENMHGWYCEVLESKGCLIDKGLVFPLWQWNETNNTENKPLKVIGNIHDNPELLKGGDKE